MVKNKLSSSENKNQFASRPPVVVVMGHVDHGKTTLLDTIRRTKIAQKEVGQITQSIGAYQVEVGPVGKRKKITFIDTPGHEAFIKMRARGAKVTDLAILVVSADEGVKPQTKESIRHIQEAKVPMIVVLNKIDLPTANPERVKKQLAEEGILPEGLGGDVVCVNVSAKTGQGIEDLLEMILLVAEMAELKADFTGELKLAVVEAKLDKAKGPVATVIVQNGILRVGDMISLAGVKSKVRALIDDTGRRVAEAGPSQPVEILGLKQVPPVGEVSDFEQAGASKPTGDEVEKKIRIILKADVAGSLEAVFNSLPPGLEIINKGVGEISESDVLLAKTSRSIIIGFNLKLSANILKLAEVEGVKIKTFRLIYELLDELNKLITGAVKIISEEIMGKAKIIAQFPFEQETVAGCRVVEGRLARGDSVKILRLEEEIGRSKIRSLKHLKEEITKAEIGKECGVLLTSPLDFQTGDVLISYKS
ncbi:GTP-binding protein [Candidatus Microgenomates bacterium]|nr:GTP-binding protein [Candidatus Microgenomates bacterium]